MTTTIDLRSKLKRLGLRQRDLVRVIQHLADSTTPSVGTVNRWVRGRCPVPSTVNAFLSLYGRLSEDDRFELLDASKESRDD